MSDKRGKYCVICCRYYGPHLSKCCSPTSLVDTIEVGWLRKKLKFIDRDGNEIDREIIQRLAENEKEKLPSAKDDKEKSLPVNDEKKKPTLSSSRPGYKKSGERTRMMPEEFSNSHVQISNVRLCPEVNSQKSLQSNWESECEDIFRDIVLSFDKNREVRLRYVCFDNSHQVITLSIKLEQQRNKGTIPKNVEVVMITGSRPDVYKRLIDETLYELENILLCRGHPEKKIVTTLHIDNDGTESLILDMSRQPNRERSIIVIINDCDREFFSQIENIPATFDFLAYGYERSSPELIAVDHAPSAVARVPSVKKEQKASSSSSMSSEKQTEDSATSLEGIFSSMPSVQQTEDSAIPLEWEEDIPKLIATYDCNCGGRFKLVQKHAVHGPSFLGPGFRGKTYIVAECLCKKCKKRYYVPTAPSKILRHWIE